MGKAKKLAAAGLAALALAAVPATHLALANSDEGTPVACTSGSGGSGCYG